MAQKADPELISGFLTAMSSFAEEIGGKDITKLEFMKFNFIYSAYPALNLKFVLSTEKNDILKEC